MAIKRGSASIKRSHARNYTGKQADARLREIVSTAQDQARNALMVDSFEIKYYQQAKSTTICTCKQTSIAQSIAARIIDTDSNVPATYVSDDSTLGRAIRIDYNRPLFGRPVEEAKSDDVTIDGNGGENEDDFDFDDDDLENDAHTPMQTVDATFSNGKDCGICYRAGYVPGYVAYGFERVLLTTHNITDIYGYTTDLTTAPHTLRCQDKREGYVDFEIDVPKYFNAASISVRNNIDVLDDGLFLSTKDNYPLTFSALYAARGSKMMIRVRAHAFTHAVIEFDLGTERLRANLAQMSKTVDWTLFDTLGNIQFVLPPTIQNIAGNDVFYIPARAMTFKVTDVSYLRTAEERNLDWPISTRILQPQESLGRIHKAFKLY